MHAVKPKVYKIAETRINVISIENMLKDLDGHSEHMKTVLQGQDSEALTEVSGRMCYRSYGLGVNPNLTKVRTDYNEDFKNTLEKGDGSIFEHASVTFAFLGVSRVFTHELVRHRVGVAISQESMRYVRITDVGMWLPEDLTDAQKRTMHEAVKDIEDAYRRLESTFKFNTMTMQEKKAATSTLRRIIPDGIATNIIWTTNHRNLRHVLEMRTDPAAEVEIRMVFNEVAEIVKSCYPGIYQDFIGENTGDGLKWWKAGLRRKV